MAFEKLSGKTSGRTPEQQAARDARKAAKRAQELASKLDTPAEAEVDAKENDIKVDETEAESSTATKKRKHNTDVEELEVDLEAPTPMNKKEARLAKKKAKRVEDGDEPAVTEEPKKKEQVHVEKRNSIWIGNLSFRTQGDRIKEFLENGVKALGGDEGCVTRVNLPREKNKGEFGPSKGFAFVDFTTPENQKLAVELSEKLLEGRKLLIKLGNDHTSNPEARTPKPVKPKGMEKQPHGESSTLFVGNLPFDATEEGLRDMIENSAAGITGKGKKEVKAESGSDSEDEDEDKEKGEEKEKETKASNRGGKLSGLRKVRLGAFEDTGRCKGFAFLDFLSPEQATAALINRGNRFYLNRKLILQYASDSATKRSGTGRALGLAGAGGDDSRPRRPRPSRDGESSEGGRGGEGDSEKTDTRGKKWEATGRTAPGAALAAAKREKVGIVEGTGSKITFD